MSASFLIKVWVGLVALVLLSVLIGLLPHPVIATVLIFLIATVKAILVGAYYMGVRREPGYIFWILMTGVLLMMILYFALVPDILWSTKN